ncbi:hypothetical protein [uncultured Oscillibacter sp.]|uniref:hypothetical protein n=1 Tax=uncultured Oscillibacter sp. TaxID=876091 RepID=UPI00272CCEA1|nr:hypothetical protein [uncultured Oscillibacter sp.]
MRKLLKRRKKAPRTIRRLLQRLPRPLCLNQNLNRTLLRLLTLNQNPTPFQLLTLFQNRTQRRRRTRSRTWTRALLRSCRNLLRRISRLWKSLPWTWILLLALAAWTLQRMA